MIARAARRSLPAVLGLVLVGCSEPDAGPEDSAVREDAAPDPCEGHCVNATTDCGEQGVDCGGDCAECGDPCAGHCGNGEEDCGEAGVDCGGDCVACGDPCAGHCGNGAEDCGETGLDCGGDCDACSIEPPPLRGVSLAGAEFGEWNLPGTFGTDYTYPTTDEIDYFIALGMNVFRLPFRWERLQREQMGELDATELERIDAFVTHATGEGAWVLLDPHNYARYGGQLIGDGVPVESFADFWSRLADHFQTNERVVFGLMNEPHDMATELWLSDANAAIAAIRATGATNLVTVPGNAWTGAHSWTQDWYGTSNADVMPGIVDPAQNFVFEVHQYLDGDSSGTDVDNCVSATIGSERLAAITTWLEESGHRAFLGEFGAGTSETCLAAVDDLLDWLEAHPGEWSGWTWWAAGPWWGDYASSVEPEGGEDAPQTAVLLEHL